MICTWPEKSGAYRRGLCRPEWCTGDPGNKSDQELALWMLVRMRDSEEFLGVIRAARTAGKRDLLDMPDYVARYKGRLKKLYQSGSDDTEEVPPALAARNQVRWDGPRYCCCSFPVKSRAQACPGWSKIQFLLSASVSDWACLGQSVGITLPGSASGPLQRVLYGISSVLLVVGALGIGAGALGGIATAVVGGGCQFADHQPRLESGTDQNAVNRLPNCQGRSKMEPPWRRKRRPVTPAFQPRKRGLARPLFPNGTPDRIAILKAGRDRAKEALNRARCGVRAKGDVSQEAVEKFGALMRGRLLEGETLAREAWIGAIIDRIEVDQGRH